MKLLQVKNIDKFNKMVNGFSTLQYHFSSIFEELEDDESSTIAIIAIVEQENVGYAIANDTGELFFIEVKPNHKRQGIATKMIKHLNIDFINDVCSTECKAFVEALDILHDELIY